MSSPEGVQPQKIEASTKNEDARTKKLKSGMSPVKPLHGGKMKKVSEIHKKQNMKSVENLPSNENPLSGGPTTF